MEEVALPRTDPRILESPLEASLELAELSGQWLPGLKRRSARLCLLGILWSIAVAGLAFLTGLYLYEFYISGNLNPSLEVIAYLTLTFVFIPSMGLGMALFLTATRERQFLPFLESASGALAALEKTAPVKEPAEARLPDENGPGDPLAGIIGSAMWVGKLVPTAERMAVVARAVVALLLLGLGYLTLLVLLGLYFGTYDVPLLAFELAVIAAFAIPSLALFQRLSAALGFYRYYSRRYRAIFEAAALGPAPAPGGKDPLESFDRFLKSIPAIKEVLASPGGGAEEGPPGTDPPFSRIYNGRRDGAGSGIVVKVFGKMPDIDGLDRFLADARALGRDRGLAVSRAVALAAPEAGDLDDALYGHLIELGKKTMAGECALQLVMEVDGAYSMVPYVAGW